MQDNSCTMSDRCALSGQCQQQGNDCTSEPKKHPCQRPLLSIGEFAVGLALACFMAWVSMSFKSLNLFAAIDAGEDALDTIYLVSIICVALVLVLAGYFDRLASKFLASKPARIILPLFMTLSTLGMTGVTLLPATMAHTVMILVGIVSGIASGLMLVQLGLSVCLLDLRSCVVVAAIGTVGSSALFALFLLFEPLEACIFAASMPIAAATLVAFGMSSLSGAGYTVVPSVQEADAAFIGTIESNDNGTYDESEWNSLTFKLAVCCALVGFSNEVGRTLYVQMGIIGLGGSGYAFVEAVSGLGATVLVSAIGLGLIAVHTQRTARNVYHTLIMLLVLSALGLLVPSVYGAETVLFPHALNTASYACFGMFIWVILSGLCGRHLNKAVRMFCYVRAGWAIGPLAGMLVGRFVLNSLELTSVTALWLSVLGVVAVLVTSGFAFTETDLIKAMDLLPTQRKQHYREKCHKVAERFGLSDRETEVMMLLAKGRNLPYIQEHLYLSKSTVSTHRQHIYAKMDIHSQQELMSLIQHEGE